MTGTSDLNSPLDRPFECGECKKPIAVRYTLIVGDSITHNVMCHDCPILLGRLFGSQQNTPYTTSEGAGIACGNCGTTFESVKMGAPLGCKKCYDVFEDVILAELQAAKKIPPHISIIKKSSPLHLGKSPGESVDINPATRLLALNEALTETLKREDYEQAAFLRDQIRALTDDTNKENELGHKNGS